MLKILKNPFYIYPFSFGVVFLLYTLGWSNAFPTLGIATILFFIMTFLFYFIMGYYIDSYNFIEYSKIIPKKILNVHLAVLFVLIGFYVEVRYEGGTPLISAISGDASLKYDDFGIKSFHVLLTTFNSFLIVYVFHLYLSSKRNFFLLYYILLYLPPVFIFSRGMIMLGLFSSFFVFVFSLKARFRLKHIFYLIIVGLSVCYLFGYLGNLRAANGDKDYIPNISDATKSFMDSDIPREYYWTYLYGASPLANFQQNVDETEEVNYNIIGLVISEIIPDVISKRMVSIFNIEEVETHKIRNWLTVGTVYSSSYSYAKWLGPLIIYVYSIFLIIVILGLVPKSSAFHISAISILSTLIFMNTFSNMYVFSGLILQLVYPIIFAFGENKKFIIKG